MIPVWNCLNVLLAGLQPCWGLQSRLVRFLACASHIYCISIYCWWFVWIAERERKGGLRGGDRGQGSTVGSPLKKGLIREGIIEVYLHQLSARLLGWRRSCDPPAIVLELPAGNNQSHCYSRSRLHQLNSWPAGQNYSLQPLREVQRKNLKRNLASWKQWSGKVREIEYFICRIKS